VSVKTTVLVDRSDMRPGERSAYAIVGVFAFLSFYGQWPLSSLRAGDMRSWWSAGLGFVSMVLAVATMCCVAILSVALAEGAVVVVVMILGMSIYLTTWD
jgi:hypothetical protein